MRLPSLPLFLLLMFNPIFQERIGQAPMLLPVPLRVGLPKAPRVTHPLDAAVNVAALLANGVGGLPAYGAGYFVGVGLSAAGKLDADWALGGVLKEVAAIAQHLLAELALLCAHPELTVVTVDLMGLKGFFDSPEGVPVLLPVPMSVLRTIAAVTVLADLAELLRGQNLALDAHLAALHEANPLVLRPLAPRVRALPAIGAIVLVALILDGIEMLLEPFPYLGGASLVLELAPALGVHTLNPLVAEQVSQPKNILHSHHKVLLLDLVENPHPLLLRLAPSSLVKSLDNSRG
mmetsp:Transcript_9333/g.18947  ORF Transcript_9333/g.18947 Transcript_9333/m.18947 type:complete len:291 (-) Transcript_9333:8-880(-)